MKNRSAMVKWPAIAIREDPVEPPEDEAVDCDARMSTCHAVCCKLKFALSTEEVEQRIVKWDIGHPYIIRQNSNGYCCHNDAETGRMRRVPQPTHGCAADTAAGTTTASGRTSTT